MKNKILHITSSLQRGGAEQVLCDIIAGLQDEWDHEVIYFHAGSHVETVHKLGVPAHQIHGAVAVYDPLFWRRLYKQVKKCQPTLIHSLLWAGNNTARIIGSLQGIPVVSVYHNNVDQDGTFRGIIDRLTIKWATKLVAVSDQVSQSIGVRDGRSYPIQVIPNGINAAMISERARQAGIRRKMLKIPETAFVIGSVGRFQSVKNYPLMIKAFAQLLKKQEPAYLILVGTGSDKQMLRNLINELGIRSYVRFISGQQSYGYYPIFDCFSLTSAKEGVSMALLEAMSCRVPCVITSAELIHPVIQSGDNGLIVPINDSSMLATTWQLIRENAQLKERLQRRALDTVSKRFSYHTMSFKYKQLFHQMMIE